MQKELKKNKLFQIRKRNIVSSAISCEFYKKRGKFVFIQQNQL